MVRKEEFFILAAVLVILSALTLNWVLKGAVHSQKEVMVADLVGKPLNEALTILSQQNLGLKREAQEFNDTVPAGTVLRQEPRPGMLVREGKIIRVTLSQGGETAFVPEIVGQSIRAAEISLRNNFLSLGEVKYRPSLKYEKDIVTSQDPPARKILPKNSLVHLAVSNGPPEDGTRLMPDFIGKNWSDVESWAKELGIRVDRREESSASPAETVTQQEFPPDTQIDAVRTLQFAVSSGNLGTGASRPEGAQTLKFHYEFPQGESSKNYIFVLLDSSGSREIWRGYPPPGTKLDIPLPANVTASARIRVFVNGIMTEERAIP